MKNKKLDKNYLKAIKDIANLSDNKGYGVIYNLKR